MNEGPPPLPKSIEASTFANYAASACLATPILVGGICIIFSAALKSVDNDSLRPLYLAGGLMATSVCLIGVILGLLSIVMARPGQRTSVLARALSGLAIVGLLASIAIPNFTRARAQALDRRKALDDIHAAADDLRVQAASALTNANGTSADTRQLRRTLSEAADKSTGENAAILRSSELYLERLQPLQTAFSKATKELTAAKVLSAATLENRDQLTERKALVQKFIEANEACKEFVQHGEFHYSNQLALAKVSSRQIQAALIGFRKTSAAHVPLVLKIREADGRMGRAMLGVLDLFDTEWGQWNYDADAELVRFQGEAVLKQYNSLMGEIQEAAAAETAATKRLAAVMSARTSGATP